MFSLVMTFGHKFPYLLTISILILQKPGFRLGLLARHCLRFCVLPTAVPVVWGARCDMDKYLSRSYPRGLNRIRPRAPLLTFVFESELFALRQRELQFEELSQLPPARSTR